MKVMGMEHGTGGCIVIISGGGGMSREDMLLFEVVSRYFIHKEAANSENTLVSEIAKRMCEIDMLEMWMLTQN